MKFIFILLALILIWIIGWGVAGMPDFRSLTSWKSILSLIFLPIVAFLIHGLILEDWGILKKLSEKFGIPFERYSKYLAYVALLVLFLLTLALVIVNS